MTHSSPPTSALDATGQPADQPLAEMPPDRLDSAWVADELHMLRLVCQIADYEVAGALADPTIAAHYSGDGPPASGMHEPPPGRQA